MTPGRFSLPAADHTTHLLQCQAIFVDMQHTSDVAQSCSCSTMQQSTTMSRSIAPRKASTAWTKPLDLLEGLPTLGLALRMPILHAPWMLTAVARPRSVDCRSNLERDKVRTEGSCLPFLSTQPHLIFETDLTWC